MHGTHQSGMMEGEDRRHRLVCRDVRRCHQISLRCGSPLRPSTAPQPSGPKARVNARVSLLFAAHIEHQAVATSCTRTVMRWSPPHR